MRLTGGPDAQRYIAVANGMKVPRPFNVRLLLPALCGTSAGRWWAVWAVSWPIAAAGFCGWRIASGDDWRLAVAAAVLLLALPGVLGPSAVIPVGVDLPATAVTLVACTVWANGWHAAALLVLLLAASIKETSPVFAALWLWSPIPLIALIEPLVAHIVNRPGPDPLGPRFDEIAAHPFRTACAAHRNRWRDGWLMVAPWGLGVACLYRPSWQLAVVLAVAYLQLLVATDTVRLLHHAAGPLVAVAAVRNLPVEWLPILLAAHVVWWRTPERI